MKTRIITLAMFATTFMSFGQWTYKSIKSDFDGTFKKAYTETSNSGYLMLEKGESAPFFALKGSYFCDDTTIVDLIFVCNGVNKKYQLSAIKSKDGRLYYFSEDAWTEEFTIDFKSASRCLIRVNQSYCTSDYYEFKMTNSSAAYDFITK